MTSPRPQRPSPGTGRLAGITPGAAVLVVGAVVTAMLLRSAFVAAHRTIGWVVACVVVAVLIDPVVGALQRRVPRWLAIAVVLVGLVAVVVLVATVAYREVVDSLAELERAAPDAAAGMEERYSWLAEVRLTDRVSAFVEELHDRAAAGTVDRVIGIVPTYLVTGILMLFVLGYGRRYWSGLLGLIDDPDRARRVDLIGRRTAASGRAYIGWTLLHVVGNTAVFGAVCSLLGLPAPLSLGFVAGAFTIFPLVGVLAGAMPALLLAFGLHDWWVGTVVAIVAIALQVFEATVVRPRVDRRTVRVGPTVPLVVGLLGFELYGVGAAVYAVALGVFALAALDAAGARDDEPG